jgi:hypothetical protein
LLDCLRICNYISLWNYTLCNFKELNCGASRNHSFVCTTEYAHSDDCRHHEALSTLKLFSDLPYFIGSNVNSVSG